jgi:hypothetical protein
MVTLAVVSAMFGKALAWITTEPVEIGVTGTRTLFVLGRKVTVAGTVATFGSLELRLIVRPPFGATPPDRINVRFCVEFPLMVRDGGEKLTVILGATTTTSLEDGKPNTIAVMVVVPTLIPVTRGCVDCV